MAEFDKKAATWDDDQSRVQRAEVIADFMAKTIDLSKIDTALEYGSGTGLLSFALKDKLKHVILMDNSEEMIKVAKDKCTSLHAPHFKPIKFDLLEQPLPEYKVDLVYILLTLHHIDNTEAILSKFYQILNPNGFLVIIDLDKEDGSFHPSGFHGHHGFDRKELEAILQTNGLTPVNYEICYELQRDYDESIKKYPLFLMVAKKKG